MDEVKPFDIPKREVWEAFKKVKANQGAAGVDGQSIADFEADLTNNLYELWNRLSSGSYSSAGATRGYSEDGWRYAAVGHIQLSLTVSLRKLPIATWSRVWSRRSMPNSGYDRGKSAIDAVRRVRQRCWRHDWVLDLDVKAYFDSIDCELMLRAARRHTNRPWVLLYIERWLKAPMQMEDGSIVPRMSGTPQGGVTSPILANLFLHYAFDMWMARRCPHVPFERYADDAICHCKSVEEAQVLWSAARMAIRRPRSQRRARSRCGSV